MSAIQKGLARITDAVGEVAKLSAYTRDNVERLSKAIDEVTGGIAESKREARELVKTTQNLKVDVDRLHTLGSSGGFAISASSRVSWAAADGDDGGGPAGGKGDTSRAATREETGASGTRGTAGGASAEGAGDHDTGSHGAAAGGRGTHGGSSRAGAPEPSDEIEELQGAD